ncbi:MAG: hypothetical protein CMQ34_08325 [Gammaproteobacteria bacterium]|nr:hypothetical protein [Gammaproteobacteria bacterium]|tara:strand:+ start:1990 stop:3084 length:1095 start_codon:yes stop_codon:yes gene_type:complete
MEAEMTTLLGDCFSSSREKGYEGLPLLSVTLNDGLVTRESLERKSDTNLAADEHLLVREGYIAYNMMRAWQGALGRADRDGLVSPAYVALKPKKNINSRYAEYLFKTPRLIYSFWAYSYGLTEDRLRLYFKDFARIPARIVSLPEQKKIAEILSTWDEAIAANEDLVANSRQRKKALMQKLLTGGTRLPGFEGEWKKCSIGDLLKIGSGKDYKHLGSGNIPVHGTGGYMLSVNDYLYDGDSVCIGRKGTIDNPFMLHGKFWTVDTLFYTHSFNCSDPHYIYHLFCSINWKAHNEASGVPSLSKTTIEKIKVAVPSLDEQQAIARVLNTARDEIEALEQRINNIKIQKKALMQQLLTGKRRVTLS